MIVVTLGNVLRVLSNTLEGTEYRALKERPKEKDDDREVGGHDPADEDAYLNG